MMKPTRLDYDRLQWVGAFELGYYDWLTQTACTWTEEHGSSDILLITSGGSSFNQEVKTIYGDWDNYRLDVTRNNHWRMDCSLFDACKGKRVWMLNAVNADGTDGKYREIKKDPCSVLVFLMKDGLVFFHHRALIEAVMGEADYMCPHTTQFDKDTWDYEHKVVIDLGKGRRIPCSPPCGLFKGKRDYTFNERNA